MRVLAFVLVLVAAGTVLAQVPCLPGQSCSSTPDVPVPVDPPTSPWEPVVEVLVWAIVVLVLLVVLGAVLRFSLATSKRLQRVWWSLQAEHRKP